MLCELEELGIEDDRLPEFCNKWGDYLEKRLDYTREVASMAVVHPDSRESNINGDFWELW